MAQIFPRWANRIPLLLAVAVPVLGGAVAISALYFLSPRFTEVGYQPRQPIDFSHRLHAGEIELDCRYCHTHVETSAIASLPSTETCMNCHSLVGRDSPALEPLRVSLETGEPIRWIRVHRLPDYARFDHSAHVGAGLECARCHGAVAEMERLQQVQPLSMRWCLDCHRHPPAALRVAGAATPPEDCTACHQ